MVNRFAKFERSLSAMSEAKGMGPVWISKITWPGEGEA